MFKLCLILMFIHICSTGRKTRGTFFTGEYKKIVNELDFPNCDKAAGLDELDWQKYDNQVRGKRSDDIYYDTSDGETVVFDLKRSGGKNENAQSIEDIKKRANTASDENTLENIQIVIDQLKNNIDELRSEDLMSKPYLVRKKRLNKNKSITHRKKLDTKKDKKKKVENAEKRSGNDVYELEDTPHEQVAQRKPKKLRWDQWTPWSACSVTCGKGRQIRWRHCVGKDCEPGETEMEEKTCQMPACNPLGKIFHIL